MKLLCEYKSSKKNDYTPALDIKEKPLTNFFNTSQMRKNPMRLSPIPEREVVKHFTRLSEMNYHVDKGMYPLGSCTMKYNPKVCEDTASLNELLGLHPEAPESEIQGALEIMFELGEFLKEIAGMDAITLQPQAGSHGELTGLLITRAYFNSKKEVRKTILIPDTAHGTNPASSSRAGFKTKEIKSNKDGILDVENLEKAMDKDVAALMITNPNTLGVFESNIKDLSKVLHKNGALLYMDGANLNALMGIAKVRDFGVDIIHFNLHKTFATPHGGGGPGSGPVAVRKHLSEFLPVPTVEFDGKQYKFNWKLKNSIGKVSTFYGAFQVMVKAYTYIRMLGADGLRGASEQAIINSNYLLSNLKEEYDIPYKKNCMHEFVLSASKFKKNGIRALDIAKALLDLGYHAPTIYFPLIVAEAMMIEPTETESKESLDGFIEAMKTIAKQAEENPDVLKNSPCTTPVGRLDEVKANRDLDVKW
ncbi:aminomethyl-transferring glycine dehydrogenase subunit GcvPB [candidate division WOR-3 bacterium]|nr:aminomethyl-transferring glycine dehydrogenase subunit GcvPB [candidate division WOR-3 bacterium]